MFIIVLRFLDLRDIWRVHRLFAVLGIEYIQIPEMSNVHGERRVHNHQSLV